MQTSGSQSPRAEQRCTRESTTGGVLVLVLFSKELTVVVVQCFSRTILQWQTDLPLGRTVFQEYWCFLAKWKKNQFGVKQNIPRYSIWCKIKHFLACSKSVNMFWSIKRKQIFQKSEIKNVRSTPGSAGPCSWGWRGACFYQQASPAHFTYTRLLVFPHSHPPEGFPCSLRCLGGQWGKARSNHTSPFISASGLLLQHQLCCHPPGPFACTLVLLCRFFPLHYWEYFGIFDTAVGKGETTSEIKRVVCESRCPQTTVEERDAECPLWWFWPCLVVTSSGNGCAWVEVQLSPKSMVTLSSDCCWTAATGCCVRTPGLLIKVAEVHLS